MQSYSSSSFDNDTLRVGGGKESLSSDYNPNGATAAAVDASASVSSPFRRKPPLDTTNPSFGHMSSSNQQHHDPNTNELQISNSYSFQSVGGSSSHGALGYHYHPSYSFGNVSLDHATYPPLADANLQREIDDYDDDEDDDSYKQNQQHHRSPDTYNNTNPPILWESRSSASASSEEEKEEDTGIVHRIKTKTRLEQKPNMEIKSSWREYDQQQQEQGSNTTSQNSHSDNYDDNDSSSNPSQQDENKGNNYDDDNINNREDEDTAITDTSNVITTSSLDYYCSTIDPIKTNFYFFAQEEMNENHMNSTLETTFRLAQEQVLKRCLHSNKDNKNDIHSHLDQEEDQKMDPNDPPKKEHDDDDDNDDITNPRKEVDRTTPTTSTTTNTKTTSLVMTCFNEMLIHKWKHETDQQTRKFFSHQEDLDWKRFMQEEIVKNKYCDTHTSRTKLKSVSSKSAKTTNRTFTSTTTSTIPTMQQQQEEQQQQRRKQKIQELWYTTTNTPFSDSNHHHPHHYTTTLSTMYNNQVSQHESQDRLQGQTNTHIPVVSINKGNDYNNPTILQSSTRIDSRKRQDIEQKDNVEDEIYADYQDEDGMNKRTKVVHI